MFTGRKLELANLSPARTKPWVHMEAGMTTDTRERETPQDCEYERVAVRCSRLFLCPCV